MGMEMELPAVYIFQPEGSFLFGARRGFALKFTSHMFLIVVPYNLSLFLVFFFLERDERSDSLISRYLKMHDTIH